jgi:hypothetical protein
MTGIRPTIRPTMGPNIPRGQGLKRPLGNTGDEALTRLVGSFKSGSVTVLS